ncbi:hypothetical protein LXL04_011896 [Taraxacum kok-saghyz]
MPSVNHLIETRENCFGISFDSRWVLLEALDKVSPGIVNWKIANKPPIKMPFRKVENCNQVVKIGKQLKFSLVNIAGNDIVNESNIYDSLDFIKSVFNTKLKSDLAQLHDDGETMEYDRQALLQFKSSLSSDSTGQLLSWTGNNCCRWQGVGCDNSTGHVTRLDLGSDLSDSLVMNELSSSLAELSRLSYLDLSGVYFRGTRIPEFIGSMSQLRFLNLSSAGFSGVVPHGIGNLSSLQVLDLSDMELIDIDDVTWLTSLVSLEHLDMSGLSVGKAPKFDKVLLYMIPSLQSLRLSRCELSNSNFNRTHLDSNLTFSTIKTLDLSWNLFQGEFPLFLQNLTSLRVLDLSYNNLNTSIPVMTGITELNLTGNRFKGIQGIGVWRLCHLKRLDLSLNYIEGGLIGPSTNVSKCAQFVLETLILNNNKFSGEIPRSLERLTALRGLHIAYNELTGMIPESFGNLTNLWELDLSGNQLTGSIPTSLGNLMKLRKLDLSSNLLNGPIPFSLGRLSNLEILYLDSNSLSSIPLSIGNLSELQFLDLSTNLLQSTLPDTMGQLSNLRFLDISNNYLSGVVTEAHFANTSMLKHLAATSNHNLRFNISRTWKPPFQIRNIMLGSCKIESEFPPWIRTQRSLVILILSNTSIFGPLPNWFRELTIISIIDLSHNFLNGPLINLPSNLTTESSDSFQSIDRLAGSERVSKLLLLKNNLFNGSIPDFLCNVTDLSILDLSRNKLSGTLPDCFGNLQELNFMILSSNRLSGVIPSSLGKIGSSIQWLHLNNNSFHGELPENLANCTNLDVLDLGENRLSGSIPKWIGEKIKSLVVLRLHKNNFSGRIPSELCECTDMQIMDFGVNNLTGPIPWCFKNMMGMTGGDSNHYFFGGFEQSLIQVMRGVPLEYTTIMKYVVNMDLSSNNLVGEIPSEVVLFTGLIGLNLSNNHLTGRIPDKIGDMSSLVSLDLSGNDLSGTIPQSMSVLTRLSHLNLSHNNLSGQIPTGNQLQTLIDPSIYAGNNALCGSPLLVNCNRVQVLENGGNVEEDNDAEKIWIYSVSSGFGSGLMGILGILAIKNRWRRGQCSRKLGDGTSTAFWGDVWCGDRNFKSRYARVYELDMDKDCLVAARIAMQDWFHLFKRRSRGGVEMQQYTELREEIASVVLSSGRDTWVWNLDVGTGFTVKAARSLIDGVLLDVDSVATRWNKMLPAKVNVFVCRLILNRIPTKVNLDRRGIDLGSVANWWQIDIPVRSSMVEWTAWIDGVRWRSSLKNCFETHPVARRGNELDSSLSELTRLSYLDLSGIRFRSSPIPEFIGSMTQLRFLNLSHTGFSGVVSHWIGNMSICGPNLQASAAEEVDQTSAPLSDMDLVVDDFTWFSNLLALEHLDLSGLSFSEALNVDKLNASIPVMDGVVELYLAGNRFPHMEDIKVWRLCQIEVLDLSDNYMEGELTVPSTECDQFTMERLYLSGNKCSGGVQRSLAPRATDLCDPRSLTQLSARSIDKSSMEPNNQVPQVDERLQKYNNELGVLHLKNNLFNGSIPNYNRLFGVISSSQGYLGSSLLWLHLNNNRFHGELLESLANCTGLYVLDLGDNQLSRSIPKWMGEKIKSMLASKSPVKVYCSGDTVDRRKNQFAGEDDTVAPETCRRRRHCRSTVATLSIVVSERVGRGTRRQTGGIEKVAEDVWNSKDKKAKAVITLALTNNFAFNIMNETTVRGMMEALSNMYEKPSAANKVFLMRELFTTRMNEEGSVTVHINNLNSILFRLSSAGIKFDNETQASLLLASLPDSWSGTVIDVTSSVGTSGMTFEGVRDLVLGEDIRHKNQGGSFSSELLNIGRGRGNSRNIESSGSRGKSSSRTRKNVKCWKCQEVGHVKSQCPKKELNIVDAENFSGDDALLLSMESSVDSWVMDSGASFHAMDNGETMVTGMGDIDLVTSLGTTWSLKDVRVIPELKKKLIYVGQLDNTRTGSKVPAEGSMTVPVKQDKIWFAKSTAKRVHFANMNFGAKDMLAERVRKSKPFRGFGDSGSTRRVPGTVTKSRWVLKTKTEKFSPVECLLSLESVSDPRCISGSGGVFKPVETEDESVAGLATAELELVGASTGLPECRVCVSILTCTMLQILDLGEDNLAGKIPRCFQNLSGMKGGDSIFYFSFEVEQSLIQIMKGVGREYTTNMLYVINMDLSSNKLVGEIPKELTRLSGLLDLNLSNNHLTGHIPDRIDDMKSIVSFDLSINDLSGAIPQSMSVLTSLCHLNLSHNNLFGRIPTGRQLQTLIDPSIYAGNKKLCGSPLPINCKRDEVPQTRRNNEEDKEDEKMWIYSTTSGFVIGFVGILGILALINI